MTPLGAWRTIRYLHSRFGMSGVRAAVRNRLTADEVLFPVQPAGCHHPFQLRYGSSDMPTYEQVFVNREYDFSTSREPRTIVDAGANIGLASIYFAERFPSANIFAIEPEASNYELLKANVASYRTVTPIRAALWGESQDLDVVDPGLGKWAFKAMNPWGPLDGIPTVQTNQRVPGITVDGLMARCGLPRIDILKIDIEGAEVEVFRSSSTWLEKVECIIVELHDRYRPGCSRAFYNNSNGFDDEWAQGENVVLSRRGFAKPTLKVDS